MVTPQENALFAAFVLLAVELEESCGLDCNALADRLQAGVGVAADQEAMKALTELSHAVRRKDSPSFSVIDGGLPDEPANDDGPDAA